MPSNSHRPAAEAPEASVDPIDRRKFLRKVAAGAISATILMVFRPETSGQSGATPLETLSEGGRQAPLHDYAYVIRIDRCNGSGMCVQACSAENNVPEGLFRTWIERYIKTGDGIYVDSPNGGMDGFSEAEPFVDDALTSWYAPKLCNHCRNPPCVQVCPVGATFATEEGFVLVDNKHCIGCAACVHGCPYGSRFMNPETGVADKCTWCYHRVQRGQQPACVEVCPTGARLFGDLNDPESEVAKLFKEDKWLVLKPDMHTEAYCFYIGLPREVV
ncbi:MAG: 4Fe-4S dicluster domain-containing protein [Verrucomicrobiales bacterium]